jgi:hypothetical protein
MCTAALEDIGCGPSLHIDRHLINHIKRIRDVINTDIRMSSVKLLEKVSGHRGEPLVIEILID